MNRWMLVPTLALAMGLAACEQSQETDTSQKVAAAAAEVTQGAKDATRYAQMKTAEFSTWIEKQYNEAEPELEKVRMKVKEATADAGDKMKQAWANLEDERQEFGRNLQQLRESGEEAGEELKRKTEEAYIKFQEDYEDFKQEYRQQLKLEEQESSAAPSTRPAE